MTLLVLVRCTLRALPVVLALCVTRVNMEAFTSIAGLKTLVNNEEWLLTQMDDYLKKEEERLETIRREMKEMSKMANLRHNIPESSWDSHVTSMVEHPLSAFSVIKSWYHLSQMATSGSADGFSAITNAAGQRGISLPESHDYMGAISALVRLQKTYQLPTADMALGKVYNRSAAHGLDKKDYLSMATTLMEVDHSLANSWLDLLLAELDNDTETEIQIYSHKLIIYKQCGDMERAVITAHKLVQLEGQNSFRIQEMNELQQKLDFERARGTVGVQHYYWKSAKDRGLEYYESLCRGDNIKNTIFVNKDLICIYKQGILPYIQYKEEIHSFEPRISLFIDVISDKQADMLKTKAFPSLYRAHVGDPSKSIISEERVSKLSWLWDTDPEVAVMSRRVSEITGLDTSYSDLNSNAEAFQIVNYGLGGQYEPHFDFYEHDEMLQKLPSFIMNTGDRISTFMYYLSDVQAGGATVFPNIGVRVPPIKNSAAFWYNFKMSEISGDRRTLHAGCPVLLGQKWVGNKWIRQSGQVFRRPCGLSVDQPDPIWTT